METRKHSTGSQAYNVNDAAPVSANPDTLFPAFFHPDAPGASSTGDVNGPFGFSYITQGSNTTFYSECYGATGQLGGTCLNNTNLTYARIKQENYRKYEATNIGTECETNYGPWSMCAVSKVVPMTYDRATVEAGITAMNAYGPTMIGEGLSWGWRAIFARRPLHQG